MRPYNFRESVGYWVGMATHALRKALETELLRQGITLRQWEVLTCMVTEPLTSQNELADRLGIEPPTLAGVLSRMERDGWLERTACPEDRRRKRLHLTPRAEAVWGRLADCCREVRTQATAGLTAEQIDCLKTACDQIRRNLAERIEGEFTIPPVTADASLSEPN